METLPQLPALGPLALGELYPSVPDHNRSDTWIIFPPTLLYTKTLTLPSVLRLNSVELKALSSLKNIAGSKTIFWQRSKPFSRGSGKQSTCSASVREARGAGSYSEPPNSSLEQPLLLPPSCPHTLQLPLFMVAHPPLLPGLAGPFHVPASVFVVKPHTCSSHHIAPLFLHSKDLAPETL